MKVVDLLNKIANGEIDEDYEIGYENQIYSIREFFSRYIVDEENLNLDVELFGKGIDDDLELLPEDELYEFNKYALLDKERLDFNFRVLKDKINELVKEINEIRKEMK